ncbi:MAG: alanine dehydrogenase [Nitrospinae bacterium]|nr:alanine dehydrogenase [Nitrospinota bacterium]
MIIGIPKEIKADEYRVAIVPSGVRAFVLSGHKVLIEDGAGLGSGISNSEYEFEGAEIVPSAGDVYHKADMIMKVKEPLPSEYDMLREGQILYTYLHLAPAPDLTKALLDRKIIAIAYETVQLDDGSLPLLIPMSEIAGRMSIQEGAKYLEREKGGRGILLGGVPGVAPGKVTIIGGGIVGTNAAKMAIGTGATVTILDSNLYRLRYLDDIFGGRIRTFGGRIRTLMSDSHNIMESVKEADLVIGAVLIPGARAPRIITRSMLSNMKDGSVIVDVSIDQGGCVETAMPTSHSNPTFAIDGVIHYCVTNMPGAVPRTSTFALTNATFPYAFQIANLGVRDVLTKNKALYRGLNLAKGKVTHRAVAESLGYEYCPAEDILDSL